MEFRSLLDIEAILKDLLPSLVGQFDALACFDEHSKLVAQSLQLFLRIPLFHIEAETSIPDLALDARVLIIEVEVSNAECARKLKIKGQQVCPSGEVSLLGIFATESAVQELDLIGEQVVRFPYFEWNFLQREDLDRVCFDIDGVLCEDPSYEQNDDGPLYREFLSSARPLHLPKGHVGWLVTSRLEKYRTLTEQWMADHGVSFGELRMIDLPNKEARKLAKCHGTFKADVYASVEAELFIESNPHQAWEIAKLTKKPVFCVDTMQMVDLDGPGPAITLPRSEDDQRVRRGRRMIGRLIRRMRYKRVNP